MFPHVELKTSRPTMCGVDVLPKFAFHLLLNVLGQQRNTKITIGMK